MTPKTQKSVNHRKNSRKRICKIAFLHKIKKAFKKNLAIKLMIPKGATKNLEHQKNSETKLSYSL